VPFSEGEGAVVGHKCILELGKRIRGPIDLSRNNTIGNMDLNLVDDGLVCSYLSKNGYNHMFGARSLQHIVQERIEDEVCRQYLDIEEEITEERNGESNTQITVKLVSSSEGEDVVVSLKG
jgi:ATP-dependent Clp protease ATP-binding subunit ClpA